MNNIKRYGKCPNCGFCQNIKEAVRKDFFTDKQGNDYIINITNYECPICGHKWLERWNEGFVANKFKNEFN